MPQQSWYLSGETDVKPVSSPAAAAASNKTAVLAAARDAAAEYVAASPTLQPVSERRAAYLLELERELAPLTEEVRAYVLREMGERLTAQQTAFEELGEDRQTAWESTVASLGAPSEVARKFLPMAEETVTAAPPQSAAGFVLRSALYSTLTGVTGMVILACITEAFFHRNGNPAASAALVLMSLGGAVLGWRYGKWRQASSLFSSRFWLPLLAATFASFVAPLLLILALISLVTPHWTTSDVAEGAAISAVCYALFVLAPAAFAAQLSVRAHRTNSRWPRFLLAAMLLCAAGLSAACLASGFSQALGLMWVGLMPAAITVLATGDGIRELRKRRRAKREAAG